MVALRAADSDAGAVNKFVVFVAFSFHAAGSLLDEASRAVLDGAQSVDLFVAGWASESEALAVLFDGAFRTFLNEVLDALFSFLLVSLRTVLENAGTVLELKTFSACNSFTSKGLFVEGKELFITAADLVALFVDEFVTRVAGNSNTDVLSLFGIETKLAVLSTFDDGAGSVDQ